MLGEVGLWGSPSLWKSVNPPSSPTVAVHTSSLFHFSLCAPAQEGGVWDAVRAALLEAGLAAARGAGAAADAWEAAAALLR